jgi:hypothetical protein
MTLDGILPIKLRLSAPNTTSLNIYPYLEVNASAMTLQCQTRNKNSDWIYLTDVRGRLVFLELSDNWTEAVPLPLFRPI